MKKISRKIGNELEDFVGAISDPSKADKMEVGNLATLTTTDKTSLVGAVNEVNAGLATKADETEVAAIENVYGSKNLLPNNAVTQTISGVTFTVNADKSVTANGTATADIFLELYGAISYSMVTILTGCPTGGSAQTFLMGFRGSPWDTGSGVTIVDTNVSRIPAIFIKSGYTANNLTFKPMIRDARVKDATYVPYAMTNRELTEYSNMIVRRYAGGNKTFTLPDGNYFIAVIKTQYAQSSLWAVNHTVVQKLMGLETETLTITLDSDTLTCVLGTANYSSVIAFAV